MSAKTLTRRPPVHARILVDLKGEKEPGVEEVLGEPMGHDEYRILNIPFRATNLSYGDVVRATQEGRKFKFEEVLHRAGHSTFRLHIEWALIDQFLENYWTAFELMGCTYEGKKGQAYEIAMDVPPEADLEKIEAMLEKGRKIGLWHHERGYVAH